MTVIDDYETQRTAALTAKKAADDEAAAKAAAEAEAKARAIAREEAKKVIDEEIEPADGDKKGKG